MKNKTLAALTGFFVFLMSLGLLFLLVADHAKHAQASNTTLRANPPAKHQIVAESVPALHATRVSAPPTAQVPTRRPTQKLSTSKPTAGPPTSTPQPTVTPTQLPTPLPDLISGVPTRLIISAIGLDAPIVSVGWSVIEQGGQLSSEWDVPSWRAVGWLSTSAHLGKVGNTVLEGHQDINGRVFEYLDNVKEGDEIQVQTNSETRHYTVALRTIVPEKDQSLAVRRENARWIASSNDERLTLVTCWPRNDNTHRLILVALPKR